VPIGLIGIVVGAVCILRLRKFRGEYGGMWLAVSGFLMSLVFFASIAGIWAYGYRTEVPEGYRRLNFTEDVSNKGFVVDSYEDNAVGHVEKNANGKLAITRVDLHPNIAYGGAKQPTPADLDWLHDKAHRECFIANSVTTKISVAPTK